MRVTNTMLIKDMLWNANKNLNSMSEKQTQLSTGKKIQKPSDDPVGITKVLKYQSDILELEMFKQNNENGQGVMDMTESALTGMKDILQRIREVTVQAANGTLTDEQTSKIASEVEQLRKELIVSGNSTMAGQYLFSGLETDSKLFNEDGTFNINLTSQRLIDKDTMMTQVTIGEYLDVGTYPTDVFGIVQLDTVISNGISYASGEYKAATHAVLKGTFDLETDYSASNLEIVINTTDTFTVDSTNLVGTASKPISKQDVIDAYQKAQFGAVKLGDIANVYFDTSDKLVIEAKSYGTGSVTSMTTPGTEFVPTFTAAVNVNGPTSTKANLTGSGTFLMSADYTADNLDVTVNGVTYAVDVATLDGTTTALTESQVISAFHNATNGNGHLSDVANVYISGGILVIESKSFGSASTVSMAGPSTLYTPTFTAGTDGDGISLSGKNPVYDADVAAQSGNQIFTIKYNGHSETIKINMEGITTVAGLRTEIQSKVDSKFPPAGTITVSGDNGTTIDFATTGVNDGSVTTLEVDSVQASESELISDLEELVKGLNEKNDGVIESMITKLDKHLDKVVTAAGVIGGKTNRLKFVSSRIEENRLSFTQLLSNVQDVDYAETILYFKSLESIYQASLSVGAKVIQPTLVDFIQ